MNLCPLENICRLCANSAKMLIGVFSPEGEKKHLERKIRMCLMITVSPSDDMPKQVCFKCVEKLDIAYDLYLMCNSAQTTIKRLLKFTQENSKPAPKSCFITECEKTERQLESYTPGQPLPNRGCFIESGPLSRRPVAPSGLSISTEVITTPQMVVSSPTTVQQNPAHFPASVVFTQSNSTQPSNQFQSVGQIRPAHLNPTIGQVRPAYQPQVPEYQSVGQIRPSHPIPTPEFQSVGQIIPAHSAQVPVFQVSGPSRSTFHVQMPEIQSVGQIRSNHSNQPSELQSVGQIRYSHPAQISEFESIGQIRNSHPTQMSEFQSVGQIRPAHPICTAEFQSVGQIRPAQPALTSTSGPNFSTNEVDSKSDILLKQAKQAVGEIKTPTKKASPVPKLPQISKNANSVVNSVKEPGNVVALQNSVPIIPEPLVAVCETGTKESVKAVSAVPSGHLVDNFDPLGDISEIKTISHDSGTSASKRPKHSNVEVACKYCGKLFSENVITLHQNLHLRVKFFTCVSCDKNFTTEAGLNRHKCESVEPGT
ncbi:unnamed protein product [Bemisia tabaci]|uniref:ZAD domain-containing protein n=1 Tax=Bemisia tabaci TaxID=7038 RepID=A0A9P0AJJ3_BEMTA|nr:unnamed protein product [Bemisia tabaci]